MLNPFIEFETTSERSAQIERRGHDGEYRDAIPSIDPATSVFLDVLRIGAALVVFLYHCAQFWSPKLFSLGAGVAHGAVVVFFVLSGYLVSYSTAAKKRDPKSYILARLSRLYSVAIPALVLTAVLQIIGTSFNPEFYQGMSRGSDVLRYVMTGLFFQNAFVFSASPPTNTPFWSLSYEFWYYAIFGAAVFIVPKIVRICVLISLALIAGPNILLLFPCWLAGVGAHVWGGRNSNDVSARQAFPVLFIALAVFILFLPQWPFRIGHRPLYFSGAFVSDWLVALVCAASIVTFDALRLAKPPKVMSSMAKFCAGHTFSLYLYHFPIIIFVTAVCGGEISGLWEITLAILLVLMSVLVLSCITESKREAWRAGLAKFWDCVKK